MTLIGRTLAPEDVAAQTLEAVRTGALYVITHDETLEPLRRRFQRLEDAIRRRSQFDTDPGDGYPEPGALMDERDVVRDLVAKLIEAVEASLDGSPAVREALDELVRNGFEPRLIFLADASARASGADDEVMQPPMRPRRETEPAPTRPPTMSSTRSAICATR